MLYFVLISLVFR